VIAKQSSVSIFAYSASCGDNGKRAESCAASDIFFISMQSVITAAGIARIVKICPQPILLLTKYPMHIVPATAPKRPIPHI